MGNRLAKIVKGKDQNTGTKLKEYEWTTTQYIRDASGNIIAVYEESTEVVDISNLSTTTAGTFKRNSKLIEQDIYGSSRLGMKKSNLTVGSYPFSAKLNADVVHLDIVGAYGASTIPLAAIANKGQREVGQISYELSNHLGNVLAVVSDRKFAVGGGTEIYNKQFTNTTITNNTVEGWTGYSGVTISNANNQIGFTTTDQYAGIRTVIPTVAGESYEIKFNFSMTPPYPGNQGGGLAAKDGTTDENLNGMWMNQNATGSNKYGFVFRAKSSSVALNLFNGNVNGVSGSFAIDNVVITSVSHYEAEILMSIHENVLQSGLIDG